MISLHSYRNNRLLELDPNSSDTFSSLRNFKQIVWIDLEKPSTADFEKLSQFMEIHPTIIERIISSVSRTKYEEFEDYTYVAMKCINPKSNDKVEFDYIYILDGEDFIVTFHDKFNDTISNLKKNSKKLESLLKKGEDYVLHHIVDKEVDKYVLVRESIAEDLHAIEDKFIDSQDTHFLKSLFEKERMVLDVKHVTDSITDLCLMLKKPTDNYVSNELIPYFADVHDHVFKANQSLKGYLEQIEALRNTNLALNSNKLNQSIQILTIVMALMMPMTIITGFFGMNVKLPMQDNIHAYEILILAMIITVVVLLILFRKFGWIGSKRK